MVEAAVTNSGELLYSLPIIFTLNSWKLSIIYLILGNIIYLIIYLILGNYYLLRGRRKFISYSCSVAGRQAGREEGKRGKQQEQKKIDGRVEKLVS